MIEEFFIVVSEVPFFFFLETINRFVSFCTDLISCLMIFLLAIKLSCKYDLFLNRNIKRRSDKSTF